MNRFDARQHRAVDVLFITWTGKADDQAILFQMRRKIGGRKHGMHAGNCHGRAARDFADGGMSVRTAHESGVQHVVMRDIVDKARPAAQKIGVLQPGDTVSEILHRRTPFSPMRRTASRTAAIIP